MKSWIYLFLKIAAGIILITFVALASFVLTVFFSGVCGLYFLQSDSGLHIFLICFIITLCVSFWYFSLQGFNRKILIVCHSIAAILFLLFLVFQFVNLRINQTLILNTYREFGRAVELGNYEKAYSLMSPSYRQTYTIDDLADDNYFLSNATEPVSNIHAVEYTFWNHKAYIVVHSFPRRLTFFAPPTSGISIDFEHVDGQWLLTGITGFYLLE